jgi:holo-[acyl-carrier protein] synthase
MVVGLGIDTVEIARLGALLDRYPERGAARLFAPEELADCEGRSDPIECLAARFAAKEAFLKALGTGLRGGISWPEIRLSNGAHGRPVIETRDRAAETLEALGPTSVHVSITHDAGVATAVVVIEADREA